MTISQQVRTGTRQRSLLQPLLGTAAAGAASALVVVAFSPFSAATAAFSPPLYALIAGAYSIVPFLARRLLGYMWAATTVGIVAAVLAAPFSPIGLLIVVLFVGAGASFDSVSWALTRGRGDQIVPTWVSVIAALVSALVLFLVSFPVLSPAHRVPLILAATFGGRMAGQLVAVAVARVVGRLLLHWSGDERSKTGDARRKAAQAGSLRRGRDR